MLQRWKIFRLWRNCRRNTTKISVLTLLSAAALGAQDFTVRSDTRLIEVSVIAQSRGGKPVLDLKREDFQLFDDRKRREIAIFSLDRVEAAGERTAAQASGTFSNMADQRSLSAGITVIVLDSINTEWTDQAQAVRQVLKFLKQIQPGDRVAIYVLEHGGFRVLHDFTRDASDLVTRLANWKGEIPRQVPGQPSLEMDSALAEVLQGKDEQHLENQISGNFFMHNTPGTLQALQAITRRLEGIPGRKNLIWISNGFPEVEWGSLASTAMSRNPNGPQLVSTGMPRGSGGEIHDAIGASTSYRPEFLKAMKYISQANVAIYPVEARGLLYATPSENFYQQGVQGPMLEIAKQTGGRAFVNNNDVAGAIRQAMEDARVSYTLGFYPDSKRMDGKFHHLTVKLADRRDVTLRYRSGYVDEAFSPNDTARRARDLDQAVWSPLDANAIPLTAKASASEGHASIDLSIALASLHLKPEQGRRKGEIDVLILQRNETGGVFGRVNETIEIAFQDSTYNKLMLSGVPYRRTIDLDARTTNIRIVVRDSATGNLGSLSIPAALLAHPVVP